jgi:hypothetical protein
MRGLQLASPTEAVAHTVPTHKAPTGETAPARLHQSESHLSLFHKVTNKLLACYGMKSRLFYGTSRSKMFSGMYYTI